MKNKDDAKLLSTAWDRPLATTAISTDHAAVNGMQNALEKAAWLMGTHIDVAYPDANVQNYTLFHNPTDGESKLSTLTDIGECLWDKVAPIPGHTSWQARHLAELLLQRQWERRQTDWVVHSQGAIIFKAAVRHHLSTQPHVKLDRHTVAFHAGGSVISSTKTYLEQAGIKIGLERVNPFDLVPNVAGHNTHSPSGLIRALSFTRLVFGGGGDNVTVSPHTLPYLGVCTYYLQLKEAGHHLAAGLVRNYMRGLSDKQLAYERSLNDPNARSLNPIVKKPSLTRNDFPVV
ncbi:MAG: hypothetical protein QM790_02570 [Nibricoccus sp.]